MRLAVIIAGSSPPVVTTWVRGDTRAEPLPGYEFVPEASLAPGWILASDLPAPVPETVTPWQLSTWLLRARSITPAAVDALIATLPPAVRAQAEIDWTRAATVRRDHPLIDTLGAALGLLPVEIDQAFREAAELVS